MTKSVIGEIKGKSDEKVIVVGAHLDSWDVGKALMMMVLELYKV